MVRFEFRVNASFLEYTTHPITVPKTKVDHEQLQHARLDNGQVVIIYPHGERFHGHMYEGYRGGHRYYQIRHSPGNARVPQLKRGSRLLVVLVRVLADIWVILEFQE